MSTFTNQQQRAGLCRAAVSRRPTGRAGALAQQRQIATAQDPISEHII